MDQQNNNQYLTIQQVAIRFGVSIATVYRMANRGALPAVRFGSQWRISEKELQEQFGKQDREKCA